jgi:uncharacterized protein (TIGR02453 family)
MPTFFTAKTITFLRALERNNDRGWFKSRRDDYEAHVRAPLVALVEQLAEDLGTIAPELACSPKESLFRQYRDTRFSEDKSPLKTNIAAVFPPRALARHTGAGLYLQVSTKETWIGGGLYHAPTPTLRAVREHLAANVTRFHGIVESPSFKRRCGPLQGDRLQRVPRGFASDHPAAEYLKLRDLVVMKVFPATFATTPRFYSTVVTMFADIAPMLHVINEPLLARAMPAMAPTAADGTDRMGHRLRR